METALYEAPGELADLLDEVAAGKQVTITRHGRAAAKLVPIEHDFDRAEVRQAVKAFLEIRKGITLGGLSIRELINEGRK